MLNHGLRGIMGQINGPWRWWLDRGVRIRKQKLAWTNELLSRRGSVLTLQLQIFHGQKLDTSNSFQECSFGLHTDVIHGHARPIDRVSCHCIRPERDSSSSKGNHHEISFYAQPRRRIEIDIETEFVIDIFACGIKDEYIVREVNGWE